MVITSAPQDMPSTRLCPQPSERDGQRCIPHSFCSRSQFLVADIAGEQPDIGRNLRGRVLRFLDEHELRPFRMPSQSARTSSVPFSVLPPGKVSTRFQSFVTCWVEAILRGEAQILDRHAAASEGARGLRGSWRGSGPSCAAGRAAAAGSAPGWGRAR